MVAKTFRALASQWFFRFLIYLKVFWIAFYPLGLGLTSLQAIWIAGMYIPCFVIFYFSLNISYLLVCSIIMTFFYRELLLSSSKKNVDQHVVLLKWCSNEDDKHVVSLEFQSDKYTPRIDLQGV